VRRVRQLKKAVMAVSVALAACLCTVTAYAYFYASAAKSTDAPIGAVRVALNETFPRTDAYGAPEDTVKIFSGTNTGDSPANVRARVFPCAEYRFTDTGPSGEAVEEWRPLAIPISAFRITIGAAGWTDGGDGYLYFDTALGPGESTGDVTVSVQTRDASLLPEGMDIRLNVRVEIEATLSREG